MQKLTTINVWARPEASGHNRRMGMMRGFSRDKARAILRAYSAGGMVDVEEFELEVLASVQRNDGIFVMEAWKLGGVTRTGSHYGLTDEWRSFLADEKALSALWEVAGETRTRKSGERTANRLWRKHAWVLRGERFLRTMAPTEPRALLAGTQVEIPRPLCVAPSRTPRREPRNTNPPRRRKNL